MPQRRILCLLSALWWLLSPTQAQAQTTGQDTPPPNSFAQRTGFGERGRDA